MRMGTTVMVINSGNCAVYPSNNIIAGDLIDLPIAWSEAVALITRILTDLPLCHIFKQEIERQELIYASAGSLGSSILSFPRTFPVFPSIMSEECGLVTIGTLSFWIHLVLPYPPPSALARIGWA